jgi:hypothetical protein
MVGIITAIIACIISVAGFVGSWIKTISAKAKTEQSFISALDRIEKQRCSDMEIQTLKLTAVSEKLHEHIFVNNKEHDDFKKVFDTINDIKTMLARLEERSIKD